MTILLTALVVLAIPCLAVSALLKFVERREDRRQLTRDRQIALVDAIHFELGAAAAPTVTRRRGGVWRVSMTVPLERDYRKILGTRDPAVNNGSIVTQVTVNPSDALFLIGDDRIPPSTILDLQPGPAWTPRSTRAKRPAAPEAAPKRP